MVPTITGTKLHRVPVRSELYTIVIHSIQYSYQRLTTRCGMIHWGVAFTWETTVVETLAVNSVATQLATLDFEDLGIFRSLSLVEQVSHLSTPF